MNNPEHGALERANNDLELKDIQLAMLRESAIFDNYKKALEDIQKTSQVDMSNITEDYKIDSSELLDLHPKLDKITLNLEILSENWLADYVDAQRAIAAIVLNSTLTDGEMQMIIKKLPLFAEATTEIPEQDAVETVENSNATPSLTQGEPEVVVPETQAPPSKNQGGWTASAKPWKVKYSAMHKNTKTDSESQNWTAASRSKAETTTSAVWVVLGNTTAVVSSIESNTSWNTITSIPDETSDDKLNEHAKEAVSKQIETFKSSTKEVGFKVWNADINLTL